MDPIPTFELSSIGASRPQPSSLATLQHSDSRPGFETVDETSVSQLPTPEESDLNDAATCVSGYNRNEAAESDHCRDVYQEPEQTTQAMPVPGNIFVNFRPAGGGKWNRAYDLQLQTVFAQVLCGKRSELPFEWLTDREGRKAAYERFRVPIKGVKTVKKALEVSLGSPDCLLLRYRGKTVSMNIVTF
jgi:hypothetical protein